MSEGGEEARVEEKPAFLKIIRDWHIRGNPERRKKGRG